MRQTFDELLEIGRLRHRVAIQSRTGTRDGFGEESPTAWATVATVWADVQETADGETQQAGKTVPLRRATVTLRYRSDLTSKHRFLFEGRKFNIGGLTNPDGVGAFHVATCTEAA